jgi:hypothetical protein
MTTLSPLHRIGLGLAAGLVGTIVMTLGQKAEMALTDRPPSKVPADAVEKIAGFDVSDGAEEDLLSNGVHFAYGIALGAGFAAIDDVAEPARTALYFVGAQAVGMALLQGLDLDGKPSEWDAPTAAVDVGHHLVYAIAAGLTYAAGKRLLTSD